MTLDALIMLLGTLVALLPFLGFPNSWDRAMLLVLGILVVILGIVVRRRGTKRDTVLTGQKTSEEQPQNNSSHDATQ